MDDVFEEQGKSLRAENLFLFTINK